MDRVKSSLADEMADRAVVGAGTSTYSPSVVEVYGDLGLDFAWIDLEHGGPSPWDSQTITDLVRAAEVSGTALLVRPPSGAPSLVRKLLDTGVSNLLLPRVETADEVAKAIRAAKFVYDDKPGERGASISRVANWDAYGNTPTTSESVTVGVMIENTAAVRNLEEILAVPDLEFVYVGPGDLSVSMGVPLETDSPAVHEAVTTIHDRCLDASVPVGKSVHSADALRTALAEGWSLFRCGDEFTALRSVLAGYVDAVPTTESTTVDADGNGDGRGL